jgi:LuxR family quorum sensing-dependent transcriptional regulator
MIGATWPPDWYAIWRRRHLILHDPIALCSWRVTCPFTWREAYQGGTSLGRSILDESRNFGFCDGVAIPVRTFSGWPGCVSLGAERIDLAPAEQARLEVVAAHAFVRMEEVFRPARAPFRAALTPRETELLHFAAAGKTSWEISEILSISEYTVRDHFKTIIRKLNCANRAHAVAVALERNIIMP